MIEPGPPPPFAAPGADPSPGDEAPPQGSLLSDVRVLLEDAQTLAQAEMGYQGARAAYAWDRSKPIAARLLLAAALGWFALLALVVGLLLALAPLIGVWGALAVMTVSLTVGAALCFLSARRRFRAMRAMLFPDPPGVSS